MGASHSATKALAKASITMAKMDLWSARLAVKTLRRDQREAIAETRSLTSRHYPPHGPAAPACARLGECRWGRASGDPVNYSADKHADHEP